MPEQVQYHLNIPSFVASFEEGDLTAREMVVDITVNLRHFCDQQGLEYGECDSSGYDHYVVEAEENRMAEERAR